MSKRILVVEDREDDRQIIRDMLFGTGYAITEAEDGEQALAAVAKERPDLILMEIQLSSMDGYEAMRRIRSQSCALVDPDHRGHLVCAKWGRTEGAGGRLRRLCAQALQPAPIASENSALPVLSLTLIAAVHESAYGPKQTSRSRGRMSAFGSKADIEIYERHVRF